MRPNSPFKIPWGPVKLGIFKIVHVTLSVIVHTIWFDAGLKRMAQKAGGKIPWDTLCPYHVLVQIGLLANKLSSVDSKCEYQVVLSVKFALYAL